MLWPQLLLTSAALENMPTQSAQSSLSGLLFAETVADTPIHSERPNNVSSRPAVAFEDQTNSRGGHASVWPGYMGDDLVREDR